VPARPRPADQRVDVALRDRRLDEHRADAPLDEQVDQRLDVEHPRLALRRDPLDAHDLEAEPSAEVVERVVRRHQHPLRLGDGPEHRSA
jgi:hypothetical protein